MSVSKKKKKISKSKEIKLDLPLPYAEWLENIQGYRTGDQGEVIKPTMKQMVLSFNDAFRPDFGRENFFYPIYVETAGSRKINWHVPHGVTPKHTPGKKNFTPRRRKNLDRIRAGLVPKMVWSPEKQARNVEAHHLDQSIWSDNAMIPASFHRGTGVSGILHPFNSAGTKISQKDRLHHRDRANAVWRAHLAELEARSLLS